MLMMVKVIADHGLRCTTICRKKFDVMDSRMLVGSNFLYQSR